MKKSDCDAIMKWASELSDEELENEYYNLVYDSLGSRAEEMQELGYDFADIAERKRYEKYLVEKCELLEQLCGKRKIELWKRKEVKPVKKETALEIIELRIHDLEILLSSASRNQALSDKADAWQYAINELILVRDTISNYSNSHEGEV